jgi:subtilisin-like proprotein convertase family protein
MEARRSSTRRWAVLLGASALALIVVFSATAGAREKTTATAAEEARVAAQKIKTKRFSNNGQIVINDATTATPYASEITVSGFKKGKIKDVNVQLNGFGHTFSDDAEVLLVSPKGQNAIIMSDVGGNNTVSNLTIRLDDESPGQLPDTTAPVSGTFQPVNYALSGADTFPAPAPLASGGSALSVFDGKNPNGQWKLFVTDDIGGGTGQITGGWSVQIKAKVKS